MTETAYQRPNQQPDTGSGIQIGHMFHYNHSSQSPQKGTLLPAQESVQAKTPSVLNTYKEVLLHWSTCMWVLPQWWGWSVGWRLQNRRSAGRSLSAMVCASVLERGRSLLIWAFPGLQTNKGKTCFFCFVFFFKKSLLFKNAFQVTHD